MKTNMKRIGLLLVLAGAVGCDDRAPLEYDAVPIVVGPGADAGAADATPAIDTSSCKRVHPDDAPDVSVGWTRAGMGDQIFWVECLSCPGVAGSVTRTWGPYPKWRVLPAADTDYCDATESNGSCSCSGADRSACDVGRALFPSCGELGQ